VRHHTAGKKSLFYQIPRKLSTLKIKLGHISKRKEGTKYATRSRNGVCIDDLTYDYAKKLSDIATRLSLVRVLIKTQRPSLFPTSLPDISAPLCFVYTKKHHWRDIRA
jgi:hypothetical protein